MGVHDILCHWVCTRGQPVLQADAAAVSSGADVRVDVPHDWGSVSNDSAGQYDRLPCRSYLFHAWRFCHPQAQYQEVVDMGLLDLSLDICTASNRCQ